MRILGSRYVVGTAVLALAASVAAQEATPVPAPRRGGRQVPASQQTSDGESARTIASRAIAELVAWKTSAARDILDAAREQHGQTPEYKTAAALLKFNEGKLQEAVDRLQSVSASAPADPIPEYYRGEVLQAQNKQDAARTAWAKARDRAKTQVTADPKNGHAQYYLGAALIRHEQPAPARTALDAAKQHGFDKRLTGYQTGLSLMLEKKWNPAAEAFTAVIDLDDRFAHAYYYRGLVWSKLDRKDRMIDDLNRFLALAPSAPEADTARALVAAFAG